MNEKDGKKEKERRKDEKERKKKEKRKERKEENSSKKIRKNQLDCLNDKMTTTLPTLRNH